MVPFRVSVLVFFCLFVAILGLQWLSGAPHEELATYLHVSVIGDLLRSHSGGMEARVRHPHSNQFGFTWQSVVLQACETDIEGTKARIGSA